MQQVFKDMAAFEAVRQAIYFHIRNLGKRKIAISKSKGSYFGFSLLRTNQIDADRHFQVETRLAYRTKDVEAMMNDKGIIHENYWVDAVFHLKEELL